MTNKTIILCLLFLISTLSGFSQHIFQKEYNAAGVSSTVLIDTLSDGYIIAGSTSANTIGGSDGFVMKTDFSGLPIWSRVYGGMNDEKFLSMARLDGGGHILVGTTESFIHSPSDSINVYLVEIDSAGVVMWSKSIGTNSDDIGYSVKRTKDYGFIIAGTTDSAGVISTFLVKIDGTRNIEWNHVYTDSLYDINIARSVIELAEGGFALTGYSSNRSTPNYNNMFITTTDSAGNTLRVTRFINNDSTGVTNMGTFGYDIIENMVGYVVAVGGVGAYYNVLSANAYSWLLIDMSVTGNIIWQKSFTLNTGDSRCLSVLRTPDDGYILGGYMGNYYMAMIKADSSITKEWCYYYDQNFALHTRGFSVKGTADNGYILSGSYLSGSTVRVVKTQSNGNSGCQQSVPIGGGGVSGNINLDTLTLQWSSVSAIDTDFVSTDTGNANITSTTICANIGIDELSEEDFPVIYPNPGSSVLNIEMKYDEPITIFNSLGEVVVSQSKPNVSKGNLELDISGFAEGVYLVRIGDKVSRFVKR